MEWKTSRAHTKIINQRHSPAIKMDVLKGEEGKRVASGGRHFRPTSGERLCRVP